MKTFQFKCSDQMASFSKTNLQTASYIGVISKDGSNFMYHKEIFGLVSATSAKSHSVETLNSVKLHVNEVHTSNE